MKKLKAIDLFAGIGGVRLGLQNAGFDVIFSNDNDSYCKMTFEKYFNDGLDNRDIRDIDLNEIPDHDLLAAGFPCQPFSQAGHQKGFDDSRGSLFFDLARIIEAKKPPVLLLENVKNLISHNKGETFKVISSTLEDLGYTIYPQVLNSADYGLPQRRQRIYIVGFRDKNIPFRFPNPELNDCLKIADILESDVDESYFLSQKYYEGLVKHKKRHREKGSGFGFEILNPDFVAHALVVGNMGRERNLIQDKPRAGFYKKGDDKATKRNALGVRKLTIRECARLQGFPEGFKFPVTKTQAYKQLGNTVSVPVIKAIGEGILDSLENTKSVRRRSDKSNVRSTRLYRKSNFHFPLLAT